MSSKDSLYKVGISQQLNIRKRLIKTALNINIAHTDIASVIKSYLKLLIMTNNYVMLCRMCNITHTCTHTRTHTHTQCQSLLVQVSSVYFSLCMFTTSNHRERERPPSVWASSAATGFITCLDQQLTSNAC